MKMEEIKEPIGKLIIDSGLGEMTQDGLYLHYTDVITMMRTYAESQLKEVKEENKKLKEASAILNSLSEEKTCPACNNKMDYKPRIYYCNCCGSDFN